MNTKCVAHHEKTGAYNTISYNLAPDTTYNLSACGADCASCGGAVPFTTPGEFPYETYDTGISFYCLAPCDPPP